MKKTMIGMLLAAALVSQVGLLNAASVAYLGTTTNQIGRFGWVSPGDVLTLDDVEALAIASNTNFVTVPTGESRVYLAKSTDYTVLAADDGKNIVCTHGSGVKHTLPVAPTNWFDIQFIFEATASGDVTIDPGATYRINGVTDSSGVASVTVTNAGSGYTARPTVGFSGGGGSGATATASAKLLTLTISAGGTNYVVGDRITLNAGGGVIVSNVVLTIAGVDTGGVVTNATITSAGEFTTLPTGPMAVSSTTSTNGTGATITAATFGVNRVTITALGYGYTSAPTVTWGGSGGTGSGGTAVLGAVPGRDTITSSTAHRGYYWAGNRWNRF